MQRPLAACYTDAELLINSSRHEYRKARQRSTDTFFCEVRRTH